uniref:Retrovirus-related Pol polyprotein from transposon TNT 1-94 n=1 Tax=Tanacetum cinerariifolium TaxID=118510 RepID=A0A6L2KQZ2_TANCI|nr:hypothetical protein [Tanacetum cinerariifolium]
MRVEVGQSSGSVSEPERPKRVSAFRQPTLTTWIDLEDAPSIAPLPISSPMIPQTIPLPIASPATVEIEGFLIELRARVEMQEGLIHDHTVLLGKISPALFKRYDRDIGELFTRSGAIIEERHAWLDLAEIVDSMTRGQEPGGDVGCKICEGVHLTKGLPLNKDGKGVEQVKYIGLLDETIKKFMKESNKKQAAFDEWIRKFRDDTDLNLRMLDATTKNLQLVDKKRGSYAAIAPKLEPHKFNKWKKQILCYLAGMEPHYLKCIKDGPFQLKKADDDAKLGSQWTQDVRRVVVQDQRFKSIIMSCLPDDIMESVISCVTAKETWTDLGMRNANHTQTLDLADIYGRFVCEDNLIQESPLSSQNPKTFQPKNKGLVVDTFNWDEKEVSDKEEVTQVKALMALADDELTVGKSHARNGEWVNITIRKCRDELLILKQAKLDVVTFQIQNTELTKLNHALQEQLNEEKKINETLLTSSKKVSQCISEQIPHQKKKILGGELLIESSSKMKKMKIFSFLLPWGGENYKTQPYQYASSSKKILKAKAKPFPPCTHYSFSDRRPDDCRNYPECEICGSCDHFTLGHNRVIYIRRGMLAESS